MVKQKEQVRSAFKKARIAMSWRIIKIWEESSEHLSLVHWWCIQMPEVYLWVGMHICIHALGHFFFQKWWTTHPYSSTKFIPTSDFSLVLQTDQDIILPDSHKGFCLSHFNMGPLPIDTFLPSISLPPECKPLEGRKLACLLLYLLMYVQTLGKCPINIC